MKNFSLIIATVLLTVTVPAWAEITIHTGVKEQYFVVSAVSIGDRQWYECGIIIATPRQLLGMERSHSLSVLDMYEKATSRGLRLVPRMVVEELSPDHREKLGGDFFVLEILPHERGLDPTHQRYGYSSFTSKGEESHFFNNREEKEGMGNISPESRWLWLIDG